MPLSQNPPNRDENQTPQGILPGFSGEKRRILVAPLDWGLGHATRCIPLIRQLQALGHTVLLAGEGSVASLLQAEFPQLTLLPLPGYRVRYARSGKGMTWAMLRQIPRISNTIREEHRWLLKTVEKEKIDFIISDNRYGLWHPGVPSVILTHQLAVQHPAARWTEPLIRKMLYRHISRFRACWVPDTDDNGGLAGILSHTANGPGIPVHFIGWLSRFEPSPHAVIPGHWLILLSGPEPQRSLLENLLLRQLETFTGTATVVRGLPGHERALPSTGRFNFYNHLPAAELQTLIGEAEYVLTRSGYSTLMDLLKLQKKAFLIPTPGQTEQEYLALRCAESGIAPFSSQDDFSLAGALETCRQFDYQLPSFQSLSTEKLASLLLSAAR